MTRFFCVAKTALDLIFRVKSEYRISAVDKYYKPIPVQYGRPTCRPDGQCFISAAADIVSSHSVGADRLVKNSFAAVSSSSC